MLLQGLPHDIPSHFGIVLQVNEDYKLPYQENRIHCRSPWHKTKLFFDDVGYPP
jgi:hypothetical protein